MLLPIWIAVLMHQERLRFRYDFTVYALDAFAWLKVDFCDFSDLRARALAGVMAGQRWLNGGCWLECFIVN